MALATETASIKAIKASGDSCFFMIDGSVISSLAELADTFDTMSNDVFYYHVNDFKHDFSSWVKEVFKEDKLSDNLGGAKTADRCQIIILRHLLK